MLLQIMMVTDTETAKIENAELTFLTKTGGCKITDRVNIKDYIMVL